MSTETGKKNSKRGIELLVFAVLLSVILAVLSDVFMYKAGPDGGRLWNLYRGYGDNIDVLVVGSSHAGHVISRRLWEERGIAAYTLTNEAQPADVAYYSVREALKHRHPVVVLVETANLPDNDIDNPDTVYEPNLNSDAYFRTSPLYLRMVADQLTTYGLSLKEDGIPLLYRWPQIHGRYTELSRDDFINVAPYINTDIDPATSVHENPPALVLSDERAPISPSGERYLRGIIDVCARKHAALVLFHTPYPSAVDSVKQQNTIGDIAEEAGVPFLDFNRLLDESGIDFAQHLCRDGNHMNEAGSILVTDYLADWLSAHYTLADHRGDPAYTLWDQDARAGSNQQVREALQEAEDLEQYTEILAEHLTEYTMMISMDGNYMANEEVPVAECLARFGIDTASYPDGGTVVIDRGSVMWSSAGQETYAWHAKPGRQTLSVRRKQPNAAWIAADHSGESNTNDGLFVGGTNYVRAINGVNILAYDSFTDEVVDAAGVDVYLSGEPVHETVVY